MDGINYLDSLAPWKGQATVSLDPVRRLMAALGNPQDAIPSIHIAGTNGKGSVSAAIASILGAAGHRVGLNISPHLTKPNERIVIDGLPISDGFLDRVGLDIKKAAHSADLNPSYFEAITAAAFLCFAQEKLDWMIIETGLGGRLDATNVISKPRASVIVSIDKDHEHILGEGVLQIAREKAGIIKPYSRLICGQILEEPLSEIVQVAKQVNCSEIRRFGRDFSASCSDGIISFSDTLGHFFKVIPTLHGQHQVANMATAVETCLLVGASAEECKSGIKNVFWPGRLEEGRIGAHKLIVDCAHNPAGIEALAKYLKENQLSQCSIGFGAIDTKNWRNMIDILSPYVKNWHLLSPEAFNSVSPESIVDYLSRFGVTPTLWAKDYTGFADFIRVSGEETVLVTGSIYLVGRLRSCLGLSDKPIWTMAKA